MPSIGGAEGEGVDAQVMFLPMSPCSPFLSANDCYGNSDNCNSS